MPREARSNKVQATSSDEITIDLDGHSVRLTRLAKALFAEAHFSKAQVIDYYVRVAPSLLPHLKDRPVTLKRYPDGVHAKAFWNNRSPIPFRALPVR
jgi:bifunctional non-homologous end joining protein LigD